MKKRLVLVVVCLLAAAMLLAGCSDPQKPWQDFEFRGSHFGDTTDEVLIQENAVPDVESGEKDGDYYKARFNSVEMYGYGADVAYDFEYGKLVKFFLDITENDMKADLDEMRDEFLEKLATFGKPDILDHSEEGYSIYWIEDGYEIDLFITSWDVVMFINLDKELRSE